MTAEIKVGLVVLSLARADGQEQSLTATIAASAALVPDGRCLAIIWDPGNTLDCGVPIESLATNTIMGPAISRTTSNKSSERRQSSDTRNEWNLFGTLAVRDMQDSANVRGYRSVVIFRREGPRIFERRHSVSDEIIESSMIDVGAKAFTRDFANNVWHFSGGDVETAIARRLSYLLTWSDEFTLINDVNNQVWEPRSVPNMETQQIPVAQRESYYTGLTLFSEIEINRLT